MSFWPDNKSFKFLGHVAPMYEHPDDDFYFFNAVIINLDSFKKILIFLQFNYDLQTLFSYSYEHPDVLLSF